MTCCRPPVVDHDDGRCWANITVDDVIDVIREEGEHRFMGRGPPKTNMFAPVLASARRPCTVAGQPRDCISGVMGDRAIRGDPDQRWSRWRC